MDRSMELRMPIVTTEEVTEEPYPSVEYVDEGWMKEVYRVRGDKEYALQVFISRPEIGRRKTAGERVRAESLSYELLSDTGLAPSLEATDNSSYLMTEWVEGQTFGEEVRREEVAEVMGAMMGAIHNVEFDEFGEFDQEGVRSGYRDAGNQVEDMVEDLSSRVSGDLEKEAMDYLQGYIDDIEFSSGPVLVHGDFHPWNVIDSPSGPKAIDFEHSFSGSPGYDRAGAVADWTHRHRVTDEFYEGYERVSEREASPESSSEEFFQMLHGLEGLQDGKVLENDYLIDNNRSFLRDKL